MAPASVGAPAPPVPLAPPLPDVEASAPGPASRPLPPEPAFPAAPVVPPAATPPEPGEVEPPAPMPLAFPGDLAHEIDQPPAPTRAQIMSSEGCRGLALRHVRDRGSPMLCCRERPWIVLRSVAGRYRLEAGQDPSLSVTNPSPDRQQTLHAHLPTQRIAGARRRHDPGQRVVRGRSSGDARSLASIRADGAPAVVARAEVGGRSRGSFARGVHHLLRSREDAA